MSLAVRVEVDGERLDLLVARAGTGWRVEVEGHAFEVTDPEAAAAALPALKVLGVQRRSDAGTGSGGSARAVKAPMAGRLERLAVEPGQAVEAGQVLFVLEAMKMLNEVRAPAPGKVRLVHQKPGAALDSGTVVLELA